MNYIKQILYELRYQKMVTWVTVGGTAVAVFLIMLVFMGNRIGRVAMSPESNRERVLIGQGIHAKREKGEASSMEFPYELGVKLYGNLDGIERTAFVSISNSLSDLSLSIDNNISGYTMGVDDEYWKIYDYTFLYGKPFEDVDVNSENKLAILTESYARKLFGEIDVVGHQLNINNIPYTVKGVVKNSNPLLTDGSVDVFTNYSPDTSGDYYFWFGESNVRLLMKPGVTAEYIKDQVKNRFDQLKREYEQEGITFVYHKQPFTLEDVSFGITGSNSHGSNGDPSTEENKRTMAVIYFLLLLLPAINLSNMTRSRLMHRVSEIGVRRAFGAKRISIISQIFAENMLLSIAGGVIGLCLCILFLILFSSFLIPLFNSSIQNIERGESLDVFLHIFDFKTFFIAFGACFVLNVLSASVPAWKASAVEPAIAISKTK